MIKPFVNSIVGIGELEKKQPFIAGKCDEVNAVGMLLMLKTNGHN
jgi:hypothetical protein